MAKNRVFVVGVGMTKFEKPGSREGWDYPQMANESGNKALADAGISYDQVEQGYVGYCSGDSTSGRACASSSRMGTDSAASPRTRRTETSRQHSSAGGSASCNLIEPVPGDTCQPAG